MIMSIMIISMKQCICMFLLQADKQLRDQQFEERRVTLERKLGKVKPFYPLSTCMALNHANKSRMDFFKFTHKL